MYSKGAYSPVYDVRWIIEPGSIQNKSNLFKADASSLLVYNMTRDFCLRKELIRRNLFEGVGNRHSPSPHTHIYKSVIQ